MKKTKYVYASKLNGGTDQGIVDLDSGKLICLCPKENADILLKSLNAASEMYDALEKIEQQVEYQLNVLENPYVDVTIFEKDAKALLEALSKARGEKYPNG